MCTKAEFIFSEIQLYYDIFLQFQNLCFLFQHGLNEI